jgi:pyruvate formate lyase activating enzyme
MIKQKQISADQIISMFLKNQSFYKNGGITLSGGEPLLQLNFVLDLAKKCYEREISLALDTSAANFNQSTLQQYLAIIRHQPL